ncbi:MAG: hypothetical protein IE922_09575 [Sphingomonadales bacterium]|nr:hypothetical protein [Sphingomonadales bacterium]
MLDASDYGPGEQSFLAARTMAPQAALAAACLAATGCHGYLVGAGYALHAPGAALVDPARPEITVEIDRDLDEAALAPFGLVLSQLRRPGAGTDGPLPARAAIAVLGLRLGLLARMLDTSYAHLEGRSSFGQRLIHQPLIKGQFAASGALMTRVRAELQQGPSAGPAWVHALHDEIDRHSAQAAKLMGGHGFLEGSVNSLEYLSSLVRAALAPRHDSRAG